MGVTVKAGPSAWNGSPPLGTLDLSARRSAGVDDISRTATCSIMGKVCGPVTQRIVEREQVHETRISKVRRRRLHGQAEGAKRSEQVKVKPARAKKSEFDKGERDVTAETCDDNVRAGT